MFLSFIFILGLMANSPISYAAYTEAIKKVEIQSPNNNPNMLEPKSWHIDKSAEWVGYGKAKVTMDLNTAFKKKGSDKKDVVLVLDVSGSMWGDKIDRVKEDASDLVKKLLVSDPNNKIGLAVFSDEGTKILDFSSNEEALLGEINNLEVGGQTNYYEGMLRAEEIIGDYQMQEGRGLAILFLTDGYPNRCNSQEIGVYRRLKARYPDMQVSAIQYELGVNIASELKAMSDRQYYANMDTLHSVLFDALDASERYENLQVVDYIDTNYFKLESPSDVKVNFGSVTLEKNNNNEYYKVIWDLNDFVSGAETKMEMNLTLKAGLDESIEFYPTNTGEEVTDEETTRTFDVTPVLTARYKVHYDSNKPGAELGDETMEEKHQPYEPVTKSWSYGDSFAGWLFKGWEVVAPVVNAVNGETFVMPEEDVFINGSWGKFNVQKSLSGSVIREQTVATLARGTSNDENWNDTGYDYNYTFRTRVAAALLNYPSWSGQIQYFDNIIHKNLNEVTLTDSGEKRTYTNYNGIDQITLGCAKVEYGDHTGDNAFTAIEMQDEYDYDEDHPPYKIWMWYEPSVYPNDPQRKNEGKIYWTSNADAVKLSPYCSSMFSSFETIKELDLSDMDLTEVITVDNFITSASKLEKIYVNPDKSFNTDQLTHSTGSYAGMFRDCTKLVGGKGTAWNTLRQDTSLPDRNEYRYKKYAVVDDPDNGNPGYLTDIADKT